MIINKLYCGNNLEIMKTFPSESVDLIYMDASEVKTIEVRLEEMSK